MKGTGEVLRGLKDGFARWRRRRRFAAGGGITIRTLTPEDVGDAMRLKTAAGWNQTERDWSLFLAANPGGCFAAVHRGRVVGTVTTIVYGGRVAWIGMVLVDPLLRRLGIARRLMETALGHLRGCPVVKLDATPEGRRVYSGMGFEDEYALARLTCPELPAVSRAEGDASPVPPEAVERIAALEAETFGAEREALVRAFRDGAPDLAWQYLEQRELTGFCLGRHGSGFVHVGPVVAESLDAARALCRAVLHGLRGRPVVLDVPRAQGAFREWLLELGFREQRGFVRMVRGEQRWPGELGKRFAVGGPEVG